MQPWQEIDGWFSVGDSAINQQMVIGCPHGSIIVTLGVHHGRSMRHLADVAKWSHRDCMLVGIDFFETPIAIAANNLADVPNVAFVKDDVIHAATMFRPGSIHAVFLDAAHDYEPTRAAIRAWRPLLRKGGVLCGHDYLSCFPGVVKAVDELCPKIETVSTCWREVIE